MKVLGMLAGQRKIARPKRRQIPKRNGRERREEDDTPAIFLATHHR